MTDITVAIITLNEQENIRRCIESVLPIASEILVIDSGSTDGTAEIASALGARVETLPWRGFASARNRGIELASNPYILSIDADEELSAELRATIIREAEGGLHGAYTMNRRSRYGDVWVRFSGWYPDVKLRLYPKDGSRWVGEYVHEKVVLRAGTPIMHLTGDLLHYAVRNTAEHLKKARHYAHLGAEDMRVNNRSVSALAPFIAALTKFIRIYLIQLGFLDGAIGWHIATISAKSAYWKYHWRRLSQKDVAQ